MRIFATSDLHVDFRENRLFIEGLSKVEFCKDVLLVAGDIAHQFELIETVLELLRAKFGQVFYVPGNHELWVREEKGDSLDKFYRIIELCKQLDVQIHPGKAGDYWIVPLFSWYEEEFDLENASAGASLDGWGDFHFCAWPQQVLPVARFFARLNEVHIEPRRENVISFSHFLPRPDLLPAVEHLRFKGLPRVAGCAAIDEQVRALNSALHVFGHSHIRCDHYIERVRYVHHGLGYPRDRREGEFAFKIIGGVGE